MINSTPELSVPTVSAKRKFIPESIAISVLLLIGYVIPQLSLLKHTTFIFIALISVANKRLVLSKPRFIIGIVVLLFYGLTMSIPDHASISLRISLLLLSPLFASSFLVSNHRMHLHTFLHVFFLVAVVFQLLVIVNSEYNIASLGIFQLLFFAKEQNHLLLSTGSEIENSFCFVFGYLALYFLNRRQLTFMFVCLFLLLINYKRIVVVGFATAMIYWLFFHSKKKLVPLKFLITVSPLLALLLLLILSSGYLSGFFSELTGMSINQLTTGRYYIHHGLFETLFEIPTVIVGHGLGASVIGLRNLNLTDLAWIHSDYLMLFYDLGLLGFGTFFILWSRKFLHSTVSATYTIFFFVLLMFDNTLIYFDTMFLCYTLLFMELDSVQKFNLIAKSVSDVSNVPSN